MSLSSLPRYPLPSEERAEDSRRDIDWGLLLARLLVRAAVGLFIALLAATLMIVTTYGQILRLVWWEYW